MAAPSSSSSGMVRVPQRTGADAIRKRIRIHGDKFCTVCGDKALAHHFGALACESCKAFFRRNALRQNELKPCGEQNCCQIGHDSRRSCPTCRLAKCFGVGMKPELIFDLNQKKDLMEKVKKTKLERQIQPPEASEQHSSVVSSTGATEDTGGHCCPRPVHSCSAPDPFGTAADNTGLAPQSMADDMISQGSELHGFEQLTLASEEPCGVQSRPWRNREAGYNTRSEKGTMVHNSPSVTSRPTESLNNDQSFSSPSQPSVTSRPTESLNNDQSFSSPSQPSVTSRLTESLNNDQSFSSPSQSSVTSEQRKPSIIDLGRLSRDELPSDPHMYRRLSEDECMLLSQLSCAYEDTMLASLGQ